jgi:hypothetical protein
MAHLVLAGWSIQRVHEPRSARGGNWGHDDWVASKRVIWGDGGKGAVYKSSTLLTLLYKMDNVVELEEAGRDILCASEHLLVSANGK